MKASGKNNQKSGLSSMLYDPFLGKEAIFPREDMVDEEKDYNSVHVFCRFAPLAV